MPVDDPSAIEIVGGELYPDAVAGQDANTEAPHLSRHVTENRPVHVVELDAKHRVGQRLYDLAFELDFLFLGHTLVQFCFGRAQPICARVVTVVGCGKPGPGSMGGNTGSAGTTTATTAATTAALAPSATAATVSAAMFAGAAAGSGDRRRFAPAPGGRLGEQGRIVVGDPGRRRGGQSRAGPRARDRPRAGANPGAAGARVRAEERGTREYSRRGGKVPAIAIGGRRHEVVPDRRSQGAAEAVGHRKVAAGGADPHR